MEDFIHFLDSYKELLASFLCAILTIICMVVKKKPQSVDHFCQVINECLSYIPSFVTSVEHPGDGVGKKEEVIRMCLLYCRSRLGRTLTEFEKSEVTHFCSDHIEKVLTAPQKKEVLR